MADFSTTNLGESPSGPSVRSPVTTLDSAITQGIGDVAGAVSDLEQGFRAKKTSSLAASKYAKTLDDEEKADVTERAVNVQLTSLLERGKAEGWSSSKMQMNMNKLTTDFYNDPKLDPTVVGTVIKDFRSGRGKTSLELTPAEKFDQEVEVIMAREGVSKKTAATALRTKERETRLLETMQRRESMNEIERKSNTRDLDFAQAEYIEGASDFFISGIREEISQNGDKLSNLSPEEGSAAIRNMEQSAEQFKSQLGSFAQEGTDYDMTAKSMERQVAMIDKQVGIYKDAVLGVTTKDIANARIDAFNNENQMRAIDLIQESSSPGLRVQLGVAGIVGRTSPSLEVSMTGTLAEVMRAAKAIQPAEGESTPIKPNTLTEVVAAVEKNPANTVEEKTALAQSLVNAAGHLALYHDFPEHDPEESGKKRQDILRTYAAPKVGKYLEDNGVTLPGGVVKRHKAMQSAHLHDVLLPSIEREFHKGSPLKQADGSIVVRRGREHAKLDIGSDGLIRFDPLNEQSDADVVRGLNNKVALLLNEWIRGTTHMLGSTDYTLWTQNPADVQAINDLFQAASE